MGKALAEDLANGGFLSSIEQQLEYHLQYNHFPSVPVAMVNPCVEAIEAINEEEPDRMVDLPEGVLWRGMDEAPAWAIAEAHHLDAWLYNDEDDDF